MAAYLLEATDRGGDESSYLVVGNGSAKRTEKAPGHLDERAEAFDDALRRVASGRPTRPSTSTSARELWASVDAIVELAELDATWATAQVDYDDDPFGVQYWVMRWAA